VCRPPTDPSAKVITKMSFSSAALMTLSRCQAAPNAVGLVTAVRAGEQQPAVGQRNDAAPVNSSGFTPRRVVSHIVGGATPRATLTYPGGEVGELEKPLAKPIDGIDHFLAGFQFGAALDLLDRAPGHSAFLRPINDQGRKASWGFAVEVSGLLSNHRFPDFLEDLRLS
jgi:hypothetical protein